MRAAWASLRRLLPAPKYSASMGYCRSSSVRIEAWPTAAPTVIMVTSVTPTSKAPPVAAAREGLRTALSTASAPGTPPTRARGRPNARPRPGTSTRPSARRPTRLASPPVMPTSSAAVEEAPTSARATPPASSANPPRVSVRPRTGTRRGPDSDTGAGGRRAARGGTRVAARAGTTAASRVTATPATRGRARSRGVMPNSVSPKVVAAAARRTPTAAIPIPRATPPREATRPSTAASARTVRSTWPRVAPTVRRRASCRVRWAVRMENVLVMTRADTIRATAPKASSRAASWRVPRV